MTAGMLLLAMCHRAVHHRPCATGQCTTQAGAWQHAAEPSLDTCRLHCCRPAYVAYLLAMVVFVFAAYFVYMHGKKMVRWVPGHDRCVLNHCTVLHGALQRHSTRWQLDEHEGLHSTCLHRSSGNHVVTTAAACNAHQDIRKHLPASAGHPLAAGPAAST
jgi:hypothetical protein